MAFELLTKKRQQNSWKPLDAFYQNNKEDFEIYSREAFIQIYDFEKKRAARNRSDFSLLIFSFPDCSVKMQYIKTMIKLIKKSIRVIDHLGWCGADKLAILLPGTNFEGTELLLKKIMGSESFSPDFCEISIECSDNYDGNY